MERVLGVGKDLGSSGFRASKPGMRTISWSKKKKRSANWKIVITGNYLLLR